MRRNGGKQIFSLEVMVLVQLVTVKLGGGGSGSIKHIIINAQNEWMSSFPSSRPFHHHGTHIILLSLASTFKRKNSRDMIKWLYDTTNDNYVLAGM